MVFYSSHNGKSSFDSRIELLLSFCIFLFHLGSASYQPKWSKIQNKFATVIFATLSAKVL